MQVDILKNDIKTIRVNRIEKYCANYYTYFDTSVTPNIEVTDYTTTKNIDVYITYIATDVSGEIASKYIEGVLVIVTQEDKDEFSAKHGIELPQDDYPVLDIWTKTTRKFFKLTDDVDRLKLNFSTGVGFMSFKE